MWILEFSFSHYTNTYSLIVYFHPRQPVHLTEARETKTEREGGGVGGAGGAGQGVGGSRRKARQLEVLELLEGAENGRYKVVAKAEPYKNLPVSINIIFKMIKQNLYMIILAASTGDP